MNNEKDLPEGWEWTTLGDVVEICDSLRQPVNSSERESRKGPYPYYGATGQVGWIDSYLMDGEYVLLGEDGAPFLDSTKQKAYLVSGKCWVNNHAHVLRAFSGYGNNRFIMYLLNATDYRGIVNGTTRLKLTQSAMIDILVSLPPLREQHRIVSVLEEQFTRLDAAIASLQQDKARLKQARASVLKAAVEGTFTEAWRTAHPDIEPAEELLERILLERREKWEADQLAKMRAKGITPKEDEWKESYKEPTLPNNVEDLSELPTGWCWAALGQVADFQNGKSFPSSEYALEGFRLLRPGNLFANGTVQWTNSNTRCLPKVWADNNPDFIVHGLELVMNLTAQSLKDEFLGRTCITDKDEACLLNQRLARITPFIGIDRHYLLYMLKSTIFRKYVDDLNTGSVIQHMFTSQLVDFCFPLPSFIEQQQIVAEVEARLSVITQAEIAVETSLKRAERTRQSILQKAFSGQLVPQDPDDEPASVLLERIRVEREKRELAEQQRKKEERMNRPHVIRKTSSGKERKPLVEVLREEQRPLTPTDLFKKAELEEDEVEDVQSFHVELLDEVYVHETIKLVPARNVESTELKEEPREMLEAIDQ